MSFVVIIVLSNGRALEKLAFRTKSKANGEGRAAVADVGLPLQGD